MDGILYRLSVKNSKMPKVAICFAGLPRLVPETIKSWKKFIKLYDTDVFVHTWLINSSDRNTVNKKIIDVLQPKLLLTEQAKNFNIARYNERVWPHRSDPKNVISMWYSIKESFNLCSMFSKNKNVKYDIICRARMDWWCDNLILNQNDYAITVPDDPGLSGHNFKYNSIPYIGHNDQFGYGSFDMMELYSSTYDRIPWLYSDNGVDFCSELFLTANLISYNIPIIYQKDLNYRILRE